ncbi:MAG TPA: zinc-binding dehydrogenase [Gaiellaceae bacterium]|nr:zinc-binding dehydrogenase [Gaiellaceae bacterium]
MTGVRAAVMTAPGVVAVEEFPRPDVERGAVLMEVVYSGICGTDKHTFRGETIQYAGTPHERRLEYPLICGHENVGVVAETGGEVLASDGTPLRPGDRIVPGANVACGECWFCREGFPYYACERLEDYGNSLNAKRPPHLFGGWSDVMYLLPGTPLFRVPDELPSEVAVLTEVMAVTHGLDTATVLPAPHTFRPGGAIAVIGIGPLGLCHIVKSRFLGCGELIAVDLLRRRLEHVQQFGVTYVIDASESDRSERIDAVRRRTGGRGADVVVDCSGVAETFTEALEMVRWGGTVIEAGAFVDLGPVSVNPNRDVCTRNVCVLGIGGETADGYVPAMHAMAAHLDELPLDRVVTHRLPLERAEEAIRLSESPEAMKVVFAPSGERVVR